MPESGRILIVACAETDLEAEEEGLRSAGFNCDKAASKEEAEQLFAGGRYDLVLMDLGMPGGSAVRTLDALREKKEDVPIVALAARKDRAAVPDAIRHGAFDCVGLPTSSTRIVAFVKLLISRHGMLVKPVSVEGGLREEPGFKKIVGDSEEIQGVFKSIETVTGSDIPVLVLGDTGTGKELVARVIHYRGPRRKRAFFPVNCSAIPDTLLESELFGHERGAFTGAVERRKGKFEAADGGTLFLDEIGDMPLSTQAKILRVIEDHTFRRLGGNEQITVDVRIISATNKDLDTGVQRGSFREDLYYRLSVFPIQLPALRQRRRDIPEMVEYFLNRTTAETGQAAPAISDAAMQALCNYDWPGNVRELQNTVRRATLLCSGDVLEPSDLGLQTSGAPAGPMVLERELEKILSALQKGEVVSLDCMEEILIRQALQVTRSNITEAAAKLGISRSTIYRKIEQYNIKE